MVNELPYLKCWCSQTRTLFYSQCHGTCTCKSGTVCATVSRLGGPRCSTPHCPHFDAGVPLHVQRGLAQRHVMSGPLDVRAQPEACRLRGRGNGSGVRTQLHASMNEHVWVRECCVVICGSGVVHSECSQLINHVRCLSEGQFYSRLVL